MSMTMGPVAFIDKVCRDTTSNLKNFVVLGKINSSVVSSWNNLSFQEKRIRSLFIYMRAAKTFDINLVTKDIIINKITISKNRYAYILSCDVIPHKGFIFYLNENESYFVDENLKKIPLPHKPVINDYIMYIKEQQKEAVNV